jgi:N utilization substance protein A
MITEAKTHKKDVKIGDIITISLEVPSDFGRMAAQTAKQVIIQKLREAERNTVFEDFKTQEGAIVQGTIQRRDRSGGVIVDLGKITGIVPQTEQIFREQYRPGARLRFLVLSVAMGVRGPEIILSRSNNKMVETVFKQEIPEIADGSVEIKGIARDAGNRSKVSVFTSEDGIDPIGSCIGQRGSRITTIIDELGGEKIDIIQYSTDAVEYIKHALSPAKVASVTLDDATKEASATVAPDQFSLAIGRGGQNVRLAAALTGWKIKVVEQGNEDMVVSSDDNTVPEEIADETKNDEAASTENKEE